MESILPGCATTIRPPPSSLAILCSVLHPSRSEKAVSEKETSSNGSAPSNCGTSSSSCSTINFHRLFFKRVAAAISKTIKFDNALSLYDQLLEEFPNGVPDDHPEIQSASQRKQTDVQESEKEADIFMDMWGCLDCCWELPFSDPESLNLIYNLNMLRIEQVLFEDGVVYYAVTREECGEEHYWPMIRPEFCPCSHPLQQKDVSHFPDISGLCDSLLRTL